MLFRNRRFALRSVFVFPGILFGILGPLSLGDGYTVEVVLGCSPKAGLGGMKVQRFFDRRTIEEHGRRPLFGGADCEEAPGC